MNDSFLEDLELVSVEPKVNSKPKFNDKYITVRNPSTPTSAFNHRENTNLQQQQGQKSSPSCITKSTTTSRKSSDEVTASHSSSDKNPANLKKKPRDSKQLTSKSKTPNQKIKLKDDKLKPVENVDHNLNSNISPRDRLNYPSNSRESTRLSDGSSKENSRPSDSSVEAGDNFTDVTKPWRRINNDNWRKKLESNPESESAMMLNAIKEIVSTYTKIESTKIMKMMQDLHINSQVNLMKQLCIMTEDSSDPSFNKESSRLNNLLQENSRLVQTVANLKSRVQELQKIVDSAHQENISLKLRVQELEK